MVATGSAEGVRRCVEALDGGAAVVVVSASPLGPPPAGVRCVVGSPGDGVPRLRGLGLAATTARIVAFVEDGNLPGPGWLRGWAEAFNGPEIGAATGPSRVADGATIASRAMFLFEYAGFLPGGPTGRVAGNNFALRRGSDAPREVHEWAGFGAIAWVPEAGVVHVQTHRGLTSIIGRCRDGLGFGAIAPGPGLGFWWAFLAPAIMAAQAWRLIAALARRGGRRDLWAALPLALLLIAAWSLGEAWGRAGRPGGTSGRPVSPPRGRRGRRSADHRLGQACVSRADGPRSRPPGARA